MMMIDLMVVVAAAVVGTVMVRVKRFPDSVGLPPFSHRYFELRSNLIHNQNH